MKISIAMCTYNGAKYLTEQLNSFANQSVEPDELVICDDASEDETVRIIRDFSLTVSFPVHVYSNDRNLGSTKNFEQAIRRCQGDVIALADQDDIWLENKLGTIKNEFLRRPDVGLVFTDALLVNQTLQPTGYTLWQSIGFGKRERERVFHGKLLEVLLKRNVVTGATMAFRSNHRDLLLPIPRPWVHDSWIALCLSVVSSCIALDTPLLLYRQHPNNQIGAKRLRLSEQLDVSLKTDTYSANSELLKQFALIREHLEQQLGDDIYNNSKVFHAKEAHLRQRMMLSKKPRSERIIPVVLELLTAQYRKYSNGIKSAAKDLFL